jgi:hypothetical protein
VAMLAGHSSVMKTPLTLAVKPFSIMYS